MDAQERLSAARTMMSEGRHAEALSELIWFHEHALEENPALYGVRLSFALGRWAELAQVYPPARDALEQARDRHVATLFAGPVSAATFHDVVSINEYLRCEDRTYALFLDLVKHDPDAAHRCSRIATKAIIQAGDFGLAKQYLPEPGQLVSEYARSLNHNLRTRRSMRFTNAPRIRSFIQIYVDDVRQVIAILQGCGHGEQAAWITRLAADLIPATTIRRAVRTSLLPDAKPWYGRGRPDLRKQRPKERLRHQRWLAKRDRMAKTAG